MCIQIQAIVPVGAPDQRQSVWPHSFQRVLDGALQVFVERRFAPRLVIVGHAFGQNVPIVRLAQVSSDREHQPVWIVVEA